MRYKEVALRYTSMGSTARPARRYEGGLSMAGLLWALIVICLVFWLLGFTVFHLGGIIHFVLVIALILLVVNILTGRGARV
jgi:hypothetical protein